MWILWSNISSENLASKLRCRVGPWVTSFCSNTDKKKISFQPGLLFVWSLHVLPVSVWAFSRSPGFFSHPKDVFVRWTGMSALSQSEWVFEWSCPGRVPASCPELPGEALATHHPELELAGWKRIISFLFTFLKCMYRSHLFQCLLLEVL